MYSGSRLKADLAQGHSSKLYRAHSERAEEFRPTWQCVPDRRI